MIQCRLSVANYGYGTRPSGRADETVMGLLLKLL